MISLALDRRDAVAAASDDEEERRLVRRFLRDGDPVLFARLVRPYERPVHRLVAATLGPRRSAEVDDCAQDIFLHVYLQLSSFRFRSRFSTWLYRVARNRALDLLRRPRHRHPHTGEAVLEHLPSPAGDPLTNVLDQGRSQRLRDAVASLPEPQRSVVHLHYWLDAPVREIAALLDCPEGTVKSHLARARRRLARRLEER